MKYFAKINYLGTLYGGWQRQKTTNSIQQTIEDRISDIVGTNTKIIGCGRTDAGVHADQYYFHFNLKKEHPRLKFKLNKVLPEDIAVQSIFKVDMKHHAQRGAISREYVYYVHSIKNAIVSHVSSWYDFHEWDYAAMEKACKIISKTNDFKNFCLSPDKYPNTLCNINYVNLEINETDNSWRFRISANRFLRGMVRLLVGQLIELGKGKISLNQFAEMLESSRPKKLTRAYPQGLHLSKVIYPESYFRTSL